MLVRQAERQLCCSEEAGLTEDDARYAGRAMIQAGYIEGHVHKAFGGVLAIVTLAELTERGRRAVGLWPSDESAKALEEALVEVARGTANPEQASRLRRIAETLGGLARDVSVEVAAAVASRMTSFG